MIDNWADKIARFVCIYTKADKQMIEVYKYGIEVTISTLLNVLCVMLASILLCDILSGIVFLIVHFLIKPFVGGYHATTYFMCNVLFVLVYLIAYFSNNIFLEIDDVEFQKVIFESLFLLSLIPIISLAPVRNKNKPLTDNEAKKYRIIGISLSILVDLIGLVMFFGNVKIGSLIIITLFLISLMMLIDKIITRGGKKL